MPQFDETQGNVQTALAVGAALCEAHVVEDTREGVFTVVPSGYQIHDLEKYLPKPLRVRQHVTLDDSDSFIAYLDGYGEAGVTRLFFSSTAEVFDAVIDYHQPVTGGHDGIAAVNGPAWCQHTATFKPIRSVEFTTWTASNGKQFTQVDFARFLEANLPDVVEPEGAVLLEVALSMEARKEATFSSGIRLSNGQIQFAYDEVVRGSAKKGMLDIPEQFVLGVAIHEGGPAYRIPVRLRWRLQEGKVAFWYELVRPHRFVEDAIKEIRTKITADTGYPILSGVPK